jgi:hypothetical protein
LTPREAQERLAEILNVAERSAPASAGRTFGEACDEWLRYVEHERQRSTSTLRDYRGTRSVRIWPRPLQRHAAAERERLTPWPRPSSAR